MRDLRAELKGHDDGIAVEWKPAEGDVLVGFLRDASPIDAVDAGTNAVVVEEETTGVSVTVSLDSPHMASLFELHSPQIRDRIGLKCTGFDSNGMGQFTMLVDRAAFDDESNRPHAFSEGVSQDDDYAATSEERDFIHRMLEGTRESSESRDGAASPEDAVNMLSQAAPLPAESQKSHDPPELPDWLAAMTSRSRWRPIGPEESTASAPRSRLVAVLIAMLAALAAGAVSVVRFAPHLHIWNR